MEGVGVECILVDDEAALVYCELGPTEFSYQPSSFHEVDMV